MEKIIITAIATLDLHAGVFKSDHNKTQAPGTTTQTSSVDNDNERDLAAQPSAQPGSQEPVLNPVTAERIQIANAGAGILSSMSQVVGAVSDSKDGDGKGAGGKGDNGPSDENEASGAQRGDDAPGAEHRMPQLQMPLTQRVEMILQGLIRRFKALLVGVIVAVGVAAG